MYKKKVVRNETVPLMISMYFIFYYLKFNRVRCYFKVLYIKWSSIIY